MNAPRINKQHTHITVDFGNGRSLTVSHAGERACGAVPPAVFKVWSLLHQQLPPSPKADITQEQRAFLDRTKRATVGERVDAFVAEINAVWPAWNAPPPSFDMGAAVTFDFGPKRGGLDTGTIVGKRRTNLMIKFARNGNILMTPDLLGSSNKSPLQGSRRC